MAADQIPKVSVKPSLQYLYTSRIEIDSPLMVGQSPKGERRIINITGGAFEGPRLAGRVLPGGADWQVIRRDGITEVVAQYTLETQDGVALAHDLVTQAYQQRHFQAQPILQALSFLPFVLQYADSEPVLVSEVQRKHMA